MRWGYCCIALGLPDGTTAHTVTVTNLRKIPNREDRISRLGRLARENLSNTIRILRYNKAHQVQMYRFSSQLVPLATHEEAEGWRYWEELMTELALVGEIVKETNMRVSTHPGQHTVINSPVKSVWELAQRDLDYHNRILSGMGLGPEALMVVHVGGAYGERKEAAQRFIDRFRQLPDEVRNRLVVENDDRSFDIGEVLDICQSIGRPMVLDIHHHRVLSRGKKLEQMLPEIFATWEGVVPKVHFSSPKTATDPRSHADYVELEDFLGFFELCEGRDFDAMIEAKQKDLALFRLREEAKAVLGEAIVPLDSGNLEWVAHKMD